MHSRPRLSTTDRFRYAIRRYKGVPIETDLSRYWSIAEEVGSIDLSELRFEELKKSVASLSAKHHTDDRSRSSGIAPEVFALAKEAARRTLGLEAFDVQIAAACALVDGKVAQMQTGEGKTLAACFAAIHHAISGGTVHVLTANDYLASRDAAWMGPVYETLGIEVVSISETDSDAIRRDAYRKHVTYLTAKQAGFDYLRDGLQYELESCVQGSLDVCIVDEADFILIDEARNPLVVAQETEDDRIDPVVIDRAVGSLVSGRDFTIDRAGRRCTLTLDGQYRVAEMLGCGGMHEAEALPVYAAVHVGLHANHLLQRDVDYIVRDGNVELVDELTGRVADRRKWPYGIQAAIEAKESLVVRREGRVRASITTQHFISQYELVAGMTATAVPAAEELISFYHMPSVVVPPNLTPKSIRLEDRIFPTIDEKMDALVADLAEVHLTGRPVLVGTRTVKESIALSRRLSDRGIEHEVLNAANDEREAAIVARAGELGAVTISTNMAGRGTDIRLGGPDERDHEAVKSLGGLYVIGTNRHDSKRIDDQLCGRAGRQGDPGSSRFYVSLEDPLIVRYAITDFIDSVFLDGAHSGEIEDSSVAREIDRAQEIIEGQHFQMRRTLRRYTEIVERQRAIVRDLRDDALRLQRIPEEIIEQTADVPVTVPENTGPELLALLFVHVLDDMWSDHLAWVDTVREGIHLRRIGKQDPQLAFLRDVTEEFESAIESAISQTVARFEAAARDVDGLDDLRRSLTAPSSTWTYVINDNPFPTFRISLLGMDVGTSAAAAVQFGIAAPMLLVVGILGRVWKMLRALLSLLHRRR